MWDQRENRQIYNINIQFLDSLRIVLNLKNEQRLSAQFDLLGLRPHPLPTYLWDDRQYKGGTRGWYGRKYEDGTQGGIFKKSEVIVRG